MYYIAHLDAVVITLAGINMKDLAIKISNK